MERIFKGLGRAIDMREQIQSLSESFYSFLSQLGYTHPVHPTQVNMPIGLVTGALLFGLAAALFKRSSLRISARHCAVLAFLFIFPTAAAGFMDWQQFYGGVWLFAIKVKVGLATALFLLLIWAMIASRSTERAEKKGLLVLIYLLCFVAATALGYFGGEIVFAGRAPKSERGHQAGEVLFGSRCSGCHPYGGNILASSVPIIQSGLLKTPESFLAWIRKPTPPMPPFPPELITDSQAQELYEYLAEVWGPEEPAKPPAAQPSPQPAVQPPASPAPAASE